MNKLFDVTLPIAAGYAITGTVVAESPEFAALAAESRECSAVELGGAALEE